MSQAHGPSRSKLWQQSEGAPGETRPEARRKRRRIYLALFLLAALAGITAAWLCYPDPVAKASFLGVWIDQYDDERIPFNAWAAQDRDVLKQLKWQHINAFSSQQRQLFKKALDEMRNQTEYPVVVLISANAITRPDGSVQLLPGDAKLEDETTWVPFDQVLNYLRSCGAPHKLLILDVMRPFTAPRLGILADDVPIRIQAALEAAVRDDPKLHVLWACAPGQHSLPAAELGHSAFAFYLLEGLKGHADGYAADGKTGAPDGRVYVRELARYVQARVDRWAEETRQVRQTPQYLGKGEDFPLLSAREQPAAPAALAAKADYPKWLGDAWQSRDVWLKEPWPRVPPALLRELEDVLLRAERALRAGIEPARVQARAEESLGPLRQRHAQWREGQAPQGRPSLARTAARGRPLPDLSAGGPAAKYRALLELDKKIQALPKADEKERALLETSRAALLKEYAGKAFELAWMALAELGKELVPAQQRVRFVAGLLSAAPQHPPFEEVAFVQRLAAWKVEPKDWPGPSVRLALQLVRKASQADALGDDARRLPWVQGPFKEARAQAESATRQFFEPGEASAEEVQAALTGAIRAYEALNDQLTKLAAAFRVRDDALIRLPGYVRRLEQEPGEEPLWAQAVRTTLKLQAELSSPVSAARDKAAESIRNLGKLTGTLREELDEMLQGQVKDRVRELIHRSEKASPADWLPMNALLQTPWPDARERATLWAAEQSLISRLTQLVLEKDAQDDAADRQTPAPRAVEVEGAATRERKQALLRARTSLALLRLGGATDLKAVEDALARVEGEPAAVDAWRALSEQLRQAWAARE